MHILTHTISSLTPPLNPTFQLFSTHPHPCTAPSLTPPLNLPSQLFNTHPHPCTSFFVTPSLNPPFQLLNTHPHPHLASFLAPPFNSPFQLLTRILTHAWLPFSPLSWTPHFRRYCEWRGQRGGGRPSWHWGEESRGDQQRQQVHHDHPRLQKGDLPRAMPLVTQEYVCSGMARLRCCVGSVSCQLKSYPLS